jgi:pimeloyl-ACP methyl ester carboxylesterase
VRGVTHAVGFGIDLALKQLEPLLGRGTSSPRREALLAALNGVLGDYLAASANPLAITMRLRRDGHALELDAQALAATLPAAGSKVMVLAHGLCMNDIQWARGGHDHGAALAAELGHTALYLHYNSGLHISTNGRAFADMLEKLIQAWPVPITELVIVGHSMGGLLARSACHYARGRRHVWPTHLKSLVFLGTPHHGAPLERAGNRADMFIGISPYTAPFARLGKLRSAGIKDLRHGNLLDTDWQGVHVNAAHDMRKPVPLPAGVRCYAIAATKRAPPSAPVTRLPGDGLVQVASALGRHDKTHFALPIPASHTRICYGLNHFELLSSTEVCTVVRDWLAEDRGGARRAKRRT